jgi:integrase
VALNKLTAIQIKNATGPKVLSDGGNLYLNVTAGGGKSWLFIFNRQTEPNGRMKRTELGLGALQTVSAPEARERRNAYNRELAAGRDPRALHLKLKRTGSDGMSFGACAEDFITKNEPAWRNAKHAAQWRTTLAGYASPIWSKPVAAVDTADVLRILSPLWSTKPETASRLRGRIEAVLDAAKAQGLRTGDNPATWKGHLASILPKRARLTRGHHAAMPIDEIPAFMARLREQSGVAARALEFTILTAARSGEALGAQWSEIGGGTWAVPPSRMKGRRLHRVPLSEAATRVLDAQRVAGFDGPHVFPGAKLGATLSNMALAMTLRRMGVAVTAHGFRSTFRDWAAERTHFPREVCEMALAHAIGDATEAAYRRGDLFEKRRELMDAWASFCLGSRS